MKTKKMKKAISQINITRIFDATKKTVRNSNDFALATTEDLVTESIQVAEQWQKVAQQAIKGGLKLAANQQDLMFQTLEAVKGQYKHGKKKVDKLFA